MKLKYGFKAFHLLRAHFVALQDRCEGQWKNIPEGRFDENPDYVCALFSDGSRLPLPLVVNPQESKYSLQRIVLLALSRFGKLKEAKNACLDYVSGWQAAIAYDDLRLRTIAETDSPDLQPPVRVWNEYLKSWVDLRKGTYLIHTSRSL